MRHAFQIQVAAVFLGVLSISQFAFGQGTTSNDKIAQRVARMEDFLKRTDTNHDGVIDPEEASDPQAKGMLDRMFSRMGKEPHYPVSIKELLQEYETYYRTKRNTSGGGSASPGGSPSPNRPSTADWTTPPAAKPVFDAGAARMVTIEVLIVDVRHGDTAKGDADDLHGDPKARIQQLEKAGRLDSLTRVQLTTVEGQKASLKVGQQVARITSSQRSGGGGFGGGAGGGGGGGQVNSFTMANVGLMLSVTPQIRRGGLVVMAIDIERSQLGPAEEGPVISKPSDGEAIRFAPTETLTTTATISARSGQGVLVGRQQTKQQARQSELLIIVTPELLGSDVASAAPAAAPAVRLPDAKAVVVSFLEAIRTGDNKVAKKLLTNVARQKAEESGRVVVPPADGNAKFEVEDAVYPTTDHNIAHVSTKWIALDETGKLRTDKATWVCRLEPQGWRVAGMAAYVFEGEAPLLLNFEDPADMAKKQNWLKEEIVRRTRQETPPADKNKSK